MVNFTRQQIRARLCLMGSGSMLLDSTFILSAWPFYLRRPRLASGQGYATRGTAQRKAQFREEALVCCRDRAADLAARATTSSPRSRVPCPTVAGPHCRAHPAHPVVQPRVATMGLCRPSPARVHAPTPSSFSSSPPHVSSGGGGGDPLNSSACEARLQLLAFLKEYALPLNLSNSGLVWN